MADKMVKSLYYGCAKKVGDVVWIAAVEGGEGGLMMDGGRRDGWRRRDG